jgi:hypothetical protein
LPLKAPIAPLRAVILAFSAFYGDTPFPGDPQDITRYLNMHVFAFHSWYLDLNNNRRVGFRYVTTRLPATHLGETSPSPGLVNQFLKQPTDFLLRLEKRPA